MKESSGNYGAMSVRHEAGAYQFQEGALKQIGWYNDDGTSANDWIGSFTGPTGMKLTTYLSVNDHIDDFGKGVVDTTHLIYYLSFITFSLFLTAKSVDTERWRG